MGHGLGDVVEPRRGDPVSTHVDRPGRAARHVRGRLALDHPETVHQLEAGRETAAATDHQRPAEHPTQLHQLEPSEIGTGTMRAMLGTASDIVKVVSFAFDKIELRGENQPPSRLHHHSPLRNLSRYAVAPQEKFVKN